MSKDGSDWDVVFDRLARAFGSGRVHSLIENQNPPQAQRINVANAMVQQGDRVGATVDPSCEMLLSDIADVTWQPAKMGRPAALQTRKGTIGHALDSWTYMLHSWARDETSQVFW